MRRELGRQDTSNGTVTGALNTKLRILRRMNHESDDVLHASAFDISRLPPSFRRLPLPSPLPPPLPRSASLPSSLSLCFPAYLPFYASMPGPPPLPSLPLPGTDDGCIQKALGHSGWLLLYPLSVCLADCLFCSGVQRLLDARGQRGSCMPSNFFQTSSLKNIFYSSRKISNDFFSRSPKFFQFVS